MKAILLRDYGPSNTLEIQNDLPTPIPSAAHVQVEIRAASINPFDLKLLSGVYREMIPVQLPMTIGGDFSGVISAVGSNVTAYKVGDEVYGTAIVLAGGSGAFAQFASITPNTISKKPKNINFEEAAAFPLVGTSTIQAIDDHMRVQTGQRVLIHGGAGGIGHLAIQLAKAKGATVYTTVRGEDIAFVKSMGADVVIDYEQEQFENKLNTIDGVFDTVGGDVTNRSFTVIAKGGILVSMVGAPDADLAQKYAINAVGQSTKNTTDQLDRLTQYIETGILKMHIDKIFSLDTIKDAIEHLGNNHPNGKVVIQIK